MGVFKIGFAKIFHILQNLYPVLTNCLMKMC